MWCSTVFAQETKEELIASSPMDTVIQYQGKGSLFKGNCVFVKFSKDPQLFFNELVALHLLDEDMLERTESTLAIYETTKPYWVYGRYSVFAEFKQEADYYLIEVYFKAYSNPENYKISSAPAAYQRLVNKILGK